MVNLKEGCKASIYKYAPHYRQINASMNGEHKKFIKKVISFYRNHYQELKTDKITEWEDLPQEFLDEYFSDCPYTLEEE
tara:strand:+ start:3030 stop:3266 length:237 start_codon:yes stop_codon:yes gene_type:complete